MVMILTSWPNKMENKPQVGIIPLIDFDMLARPCRQIKDKIQVSPYSISWRTNIISSQLGIWSFWSLICNTDLIESILFTYHYWQGSKFIPFLYSMARNTSYWCYEKICLLIAFLCLFVMENVLDLQKSCLKKHLMSSWAW